MPKKKTSRKSKASAGAQAGKKSSAPPANPQLVADRRALERVSSDITRLLAEQSFETMEQANEFISQFVGTKDIPLPERELTSGAGAGQDVRGLGGARPTAQTPTCCSPRRLRARPTKHSSSTRKECAQASVRSAPRHSRKM